MRPGKGGLKSDRAPVIQMTEECPPADRWRFAMNQGDGG